MIHTIFRAGRLAIIAFATLVVAGCGTATDDGNPPKTAVSSVQTPSPDRLSTVQLRVARAALDQNDLVTALDLFEKAHKSAPAAAAPLVGKGDVLFARKSFAEAEAAYRAALARQPNNFEANEGLGKTLVTQKKFADGLRAFEAARRIRADAPLLNKIGVTYELMGDGAAAQKHYREALAHDPKSLTARNNLALSLAVSGAYDEALSEMEQVVAQPGSSERHRANLAFIYGLSGRPMERAPALVLQAAASKGWDEAFFARTRKAAETGDRAAILDLLNNRAPSQPVLAQLPEMPEMPDATPETAAAATPKAEQTVAARAAEAPPAAEPAAVPPPPPAPAQAAPDAADTSRGADAAPTALVTAPEAAPAKTAEPAADAAAATDTVANVEQTSQPAQDAPAIMAAETRAPSAETPAEMPAASAEPLAAGAPAMAAAEPNVPAAAAEPANVPQAAIYRAQVGAYATRWLGRALRRLGKLAGDELPGHRVEVIRGAKYHTLRSAGIAGLGEARQICGTLRSRNVDCFVTRQRTPPAGQGFDLTGAADAKTLAAFLSTVEPIGPIAAEPKDAGAQSKVAALRPGPAGGAAAGKPGTYRIQFAAYKRPRHLKRGMDILRRKAGDLLPALEQLVHAGGTQATSIPYRLRSAPMASRAAAVELCKTLAEKGIDCLVIRHGEQTWKPLS